MFSNKENLLRISAWLLVVLGLAFVVFNELPCPNSSLTEITWQLDFMKTEQASNQSILYLTEQIFEWEKLVNDFSMHGDWVARRARANYRLAELSVIIPDFQNQLDECSQKGD